MNELSISNLSEYQNFLEQASKQITQARIRAAKSVNKEAISLYWWLGEHIAQHQSEHGWGKSIVEKLSLDLRKSFPDAKFGFSTRNLMGYAAFLFGVQRPFKSATACRRNSMRTKPAYYEQGKNYG